MSKSPEVIKILETESETQTEDMYNFKKLWSDKCSKWSVKSQPHVLPAVKRIIVIPDLHGDWDMTIESFKVAKLIDEKDYNKWIGGDTVVVQVGDQIDRCRYAGIPCFKKEATIRDEGNDWKILKWFTDIHFQALNDGGAVYSLVGNHELMNVNGDMRYVSYEGLKEFEGWTYKDEPILDKEGEPINDGKEARKRAFEPGQIIAEFLACTRLMALIIGKNIFVHAGVLPKIARKYSVKNLNQLLSLYLWDKLENKADYKEIFSSADVSPLWNRVFGNIGLRLFKKKEDSKKQCIGLLKPIKEIYKVDKVYVGHTPMLKNGMVSVCDDKVWLTDYGASKAFDNWDSETSNLNSHSEHDNYQRGTIRKVQVLEILDDGEKINILK
jgi:hypothetical protein